MVDHQFIKWMEEEVAHSGLVYVALSIIYPILAFYVILVNSLELIIIARLKRNICSILVASLAITDLLMGLLGILPTAIILLQDKMEWHFGSIMCDISGVAINTSTFASLLSVVVITLNRYTALIFPLFYRAHNKVEIAYFVVAGLWGISVIRSLTPYMAGSRYIFYKSGICGYSTQTLFGQDELPYFFFLLFLPFILCALVLLICPVHMVLVLNKRSSMMWASCADQLRSHSEDKKKGGMKTTVREVLKKQFRSSSKLTKTELFKRTRTKLSSKSQTERNVTITTLLIIVIFTFCYFLNYFFIFNYFIFLVTGQMIKLSKRYLDFIEMLYYFLININSVFNPIIYIYRNTCFRNELSSMKQELLDCCRKVAKTCGCKVKPPGNQRMERFITLRTSQV